MFVISGCASGVSPTREPCGNKGQVCCVETGLFDTECNMGSTCVSGRCVECGDPGEICCGNSCAKGECENGFCSQVSSTSEKDIHEDKQKENCGDYGQVCCNNRVYNAGNLVCDQDNICKLFMPIIFAVTTIIVKKAVSVKTGYASRATGFMKNAVQEVFVILAMSARTIFARLAEGIMILVVWV